MLVVMGLLLQLLGPSTLLFQSESAASQAQQAVLVLRQRLELGLMNAPMETLTVLDDPPSLSWVPVREDNPYQPSNGFPVLQSYFQIYTFDAGGRQVLSKRHAPPVSYDSNQPPVLTRDELRQAVTTTNGTERVVARDIESLTITDADDALEPFLNPPLRLDVVCAVEVVKAGQRRKVDCGTRLVVSPRGIRW